MRRSERQRNRELKEALAGRDEAVAWMSAGVELDDRQAEVVERFRVAYQRWGSVDRDIWYLCATRSVTECARLLQVSRRFIDNRYKSLCREFMQRE